MPAKKGKVLNMMQKLAVSALAKPMQSEVIKNNHIGVTIELNDPEKYLKVNTQFEDGDRVSETKTESNSDPEEFKKIKPFLAQFAGRHLIFSITKSSVLVYDLKTEEIQKIS